VAFRAQYLWWVLVGRLAVLSAPAWADDSSLVPKAGEPASDDPNPRLLRRFAPARSSIDTSATDAAIALGRMLFFETRLSQSGFISCNTCHRLDKYGVDGLITSVGHNGKHGRRNAPTVYHAAGYFQQFWDGRSPTVEAQAKAPITNADEMAMASGEMAVKVLSSVPGYVAAFRKAFPNEEHPVTFDNVGRAIGAFERKLTTQSRWDRYLTGDRNALTREEKEGLKIFISVGCLVCHTGEMLGGSMFQKLGAVMAWPNQKDQGRFEITHNLLDKMIFKVPTLRNIEKTGPYFHDGSAGTLDEAVRMMGRHQLGIELIDDEVKPMVAWLKALTGDLPKPLIAAPELPPGPGLLAKPR
jgi:cytochrome c peroxidase